MKYFLRTLFYVSILILFSCGKDKSATISGHIKGLGNDTLAIIIIPSSDAPPIVDTIIAKNGRFLIENKTCELSEIRILANSMYFKLPNGETLWQRSKMINFHSMPMEHIVINGKISEFSVAFNITGNRMAEQYSVFKMDNLPLLEEEAKTSIKLIKAQFEKAPKNEIDSLNQRFNNIREYYTQIRLNYVKINPDKEISAVFLNNQIKDTIIKYYDYLSEKVKDTHYGKILAKRIGAWERVKLGNLAPDFSQMTFAGTNFTLNQMKGKYVVLDFWGSWCAPCMQGVGRMKKYHNKYKTRIEFIGIACNDMETDWKKAIETNQMNWTQILNEKLSNDIASLYGIISYPTKIIINQKGEIINKFNGEKDNFYNMIDSIMIN